MSSSTSAPESDVAVLIRARQFIEAEPDSVKAHFEHALALCRVSQWEQAAAAWQNVIRLEPGNAFAYINMGVVHLEQAQWGQAEQAFRQAIYLQPQQPAAHYGLGAACAQQGQLEAARAAWGQTLHLSPDHTEAQLALDELNLLAREDALPPVECVVTSQINLQPPSPAQKPADTQPPARAESPSPLAASAATLREEQPAALLREEQPVSPAAPRPHRIKLPQFNGPNLTSIADAVMSAQHTPRPDSAAHDSAQAHSESDSIAPTLRLDTKEIRSAHRGMRAASLPPSPRRIAGRVLLGTGLACVLGVMVWAAQPPRSSAENAASMAHVTPAALPVTASAPTTLPDAPLPSSSLAPSDTPPAFVPDKGQAAAREQDQTGTRQTVTAGTPTHDGTLAHPVQNHPAVVRHRHIQTVDKDAEVSHHAVSRPARVPQARVAAANSDDIPHPRRQNSTRIRQAATLHHSRSGGNGEEDTFAAHANPARSANAEEWTDKLPQ